MKPLQNFSFNQASSGKPIHNDRGNYQIISKLNNSKTTDFFEYLYSYPPKFTVKWDSLDELTQDLFIEHNYLEHSFPFGDFVEDLFFRAKPQTRTSQDYSLKDFVDGYLNKTFSSNFYNKKTKTIQEALASVPVFVILNGHKEIALSKPINFSRSKVQSNLIKQATYNSCGTFDPLIERHPKLGFFFLNQQDAEHYLQEVAKSDIEGTRTVGLSIHCISLNSAYSITREHHPGVDFRFVPDYKEVKNILTGSLSKSKLIVDDEQQQLRFRPRSVNFIPYLGKVGRWLLPTRSFLQKNEYFKGVPIYIVQTKKEPRNIIVEQYFNTIDKIDSLWGRLIQLPDSVLGFGHNWIIQGSLKDVDNANNYLNFVFFSEKDATNFVKQQGRKVNKYSGSRTSNIKFLIRKPKIFLYNLEDFLELWEETLLIKKEINSEQNLLNVENTFFVPTKNDDLQQLLNTKKNPIKGIKQTLDVKYRLFNRYVGFLFSVGYT